MDAKMPPRSGPQDGHSRPLDSTIRPPHTSLPTALNHDEDREETGEGPIPDYILEGISLTEGGGKGWIAELRKLGFLSSGVFARAGDAPQGGAMNRERHWKTYGEAD